jgi:hypothetical protein
MKIICNTKEATDVFPKDGKIPVNGEVISHVKIEGNTVSYVCAKCGKEVQPEKKCCGTRFFSPLKIIGDVLGKFKRAEEAVNICASEETWRVFSIRMILYKYCGTRKQRKVGEGNSLSQCFRRQIIF